MKVSPETLYSGDLAGFLASGHKAVFGRSGSGKSRLEKYLYQNQPYIGVFVTPHDDLPQGDRARTPSEVKHLIARGRERIVWRAPKEDEVEGGRDAAVQQLGQVVRDLIAIGKKLMVGEKAPVWCVLFIDEVHNFTSKVGYLGPVETVLAEGRKYGIRAVLASQRPARVSLEVLGQAEHAFVFELNPPDEGYLARAGYPIDEFRTWTSQKYHFAVLQVDRWAPFKPIPG